MSKPELTADEVRAMLEYCETATPGPWRAEWEGYVAGQVPQGRPNGEIILRCQPSVDKLRDVVPNDANARFCATARTDLPRLACHVLVQAERIAEFEQSFELYNAAVRRGTEMWREETGRTDILPDTAKLVAFLITRLTALEADLDSTRKTIEELVNRNNITQAELARHALAQAERIAALEAELARARRVVEKARTYIEIRLRDAPADTFLDAILSSANDLHDALAAWKRGE